MNLLFPLETVYPEGFIYSDNFISEKEEKDLCNQILKLDLHTFIFQGYEAKRKVASYGYDWSFTNRSLTKGKDIPEIFNDTIDKIASRLSLSRDQIGEVLVTEYPVGSVINWHRDAPPFDIIAGISLMSDCTFKLRPYDKSKQGRGAIVSVPVKRRSLYIMQGAARSEWEHSIAPVKQVRYSITFRTLR